MPMATTHGSTADGTPITDEMVEVMADDAERGYDVEAILPPGLPVAAATASCTTSTTLAGSSRSP